jgi:hypothetical protein
MNTATSRSRSPVSATFWKSFTTSNGYIRLSDTGHPRSLRKACHEDSAVSSRGAAPKTPGLIAIGPESLSSFGAVHTAPAIPAPESMLGSHPCGALSSAPVFSEWTIATQSYPDFSGNGNYPLNWLSHSRGSLHTGVAPPPSAPLFGKLVSSMTQASGAGKRDSIRSALACQTGFQAHGL